MDPIRSFLGKLLLEEITPVVMVLSTPLAEQACQKNGLSFREMLLPFSLFNKIDVPVRTASDQPYRLQMFKLRLVYASDVHERNYESAEEHLKKVVTEAGQSIHDLPSDPPQLEAVLKLSESDLRPSWIQTFNKELIRTLSFSEHEAFDHPVACLLVVSSKDEQPINIFIDLFNTDQLPSLLNEGLMDPKILKHYLLLHDYQDGPSEQATNIFAEMRSTFGSNDCRLLCINSAQDVACENRDNLWVPYKIHGPGIACFLEDDNLNEIKDFMQDLCSKHIIPYMEQKLRILNDQVSATRKGFRNQIRNLWWRKGKEDAPDTPHGPTYTFSSIESQIRLLGDYAFMLRDYELALSNYRLLSTDYKLDKAWKHYAGVQEMMGLSYFLLNQSRKDSEYCMENAFNTYVKIRPNGRRYATRCGLWWAEMLRAWGQYKDAAKLYFRISSEEPPLHAAVMFEQASYCYLFSDPPLLRKYGFHLILSGNRYYISDQRQHAIRTYKNALCVYKGNAWNYISDHVHFNMGRWYAFLGIFDVATKHMLEILACSHQSLVTQDLFLGDFLNVVKNMGKAFEVDKLQLPAIDMSSLKVIYEDHRTYASSTDISVSESLWQSLEEELVPSMPTIKPNWLDSQLKFSTLQKYNDYHICVVGEAIKVHLRFKNPLQILISVSRLSLICEVSVGSEATKLDRIESAAGPQDKIEEREASSLREVHSDATSFELSEHDFVLEGGEIKQVQLHVTPKVEGMLKIVGVKWTLSGSIVGYHYFNFDAKKKDKKGKRQPRYSASSNLNFAVIKGLPKLEGCISGIPKKTYIGDLRLLKLELRNQSDAVKNVKMKISHPRFLIPGSLEDLNVDFPSCLQKKMTSESKYVPASSKENSKSLLFPFPNDAGIEEGATVTWPLWFHAGLTGKISLYISIYYETESFSSDMSYRTLRMHYDLEVLPSLDVSLLITPCPSSLQEFLVHMDIKNRTSSQNFCLHQLSSFCDRWQILSLPECASICSQQMLLAGQTMSCFFKLKDCVQDSHEESKVAVQGSDVLLGSQGTKELPINVSRSPLVNFHHQERLQQEKSAQGSSNTFDFVLLSKAHGGSNAMEPGEVPKLLTHYASHCSITNKSPIWWLMDAPRIINHNFAASFCEASVHVMIQNCSDTLVSVRVITFDTSPDPKRASNMLQFSDSSGNHQGGWQDISLVNDVKAISNAQASQPRKPPSESISPFVWCASSSTHLKLEPGTTAAVPLRICIFAPGTFDLSTYELQWKLLLSDEGGLNSDVKRRTSGSSRGHPFYLTVLQSP